MRVASRELSVASEGNTTRFTIAEPATVATDFIIAVACGFFAISLATLNASPEWPLGFTLGGISAIAGGTWHGFRELLSERTRNTLWWLTLFTFGASASAFGAGAVVITAPQLDHLTVRLAAVTALGIYGVAALHNPGFATAGRMALLMLATFAVMAASLALRGAIMPALLALACVCLNVVGVVVQMRKLAPYARFNHNDLFHAFQLAALWCLYVAVSAMV